MIHLGRCPTTPHHVVSCFYSSQKQPQPQQQPSNPYCASSFVFLWRLHKKTHPLGRLGIRPKLNKSSGMAFFPFSARRRLAVASAHDVILKQDVVVKAAEAEQEEGEAQDQKKEAEAFISSKALPWIVNPSLTVESWGSIYRGPKEAKYWNSTRSYPYPVGFTSNKAYKGKMFRQTIKEGPQGPLFVVEQAGRGVFTSDSPQKVWNDVTLADGLRVHGARHFGFQSPEIVRALQAMVQRLQSHPQEEVARSSRQIKSIDHEGSFSAEGPMFDAPSNEGDQDLPQVKVNFEEDREEVQDEEDAVNVDDDDADDVVDDDDGEDDVIVNVDDDGADEDDVVVNMGDDAINNGEEDESEHEDVDGELGYSPSDAYSGQRRKHVEDNPTTISKTGPSLTNFKRTFKSGSHKVTFKRISSATDDFEKHDSPEEVNKDDSRTANNAVYHPPHTSRPKTLGAAEKQVWRKGEGLTGRVVGYGKQQGAEKLGGEQWSSSNAGIPTVSNSSNGTRSWEASISKRKEESSKSSHLLLELLQKWNKIKKWSNDSGDRLQGKTEEEGIDSFNDLNIGDDRSFSSVNKYVSQGPVSENSFTALKGNSSSTSLRNFPGQETMQSSSSENGNSVFNELRNSKNVDESTSFAISKLFDTVGKKHDVPNVHKFEPRHGKSVVEDSKTSNRDSKNWKHVVTSRSTETLCTESSSQDADNFQGLRNLVQDDPKVLNFTEKQNSRISEAMKKKTDHEPARFSGRVVEMPEEKSKVRQRRADEIRCIEEVRKLVVSKRFEDVLPAVRSMKLSGMNVDEDVYESVLGFKLDPWQKEVFKQVQNGNSVLVSAPSGAGKSAVAECCLYRNVVEEQRALFVTPYEHLANQTLHKFGSLFGQSNVGGMWTRMRVQKGPQLVVITLETLAKILQELNGPGGSEFRFFFEGINMVVLDKFHTFGEAKYSSLWEEALMLMDSKIRVIALSLPAANEDQVASWIDINRGPCKLVSCSSESTPKRYLFCHNSRLLPLLDPMGLQLNRAFSHVNGGYDNSMAKDQLQSFFWSCYDKPSLKHALNALEVNAMLPAIVVFFNVKCCSDAMQDAFAAVSDGLLSRSEIQKVEACLNELGESHPDLLKHIDEADREGLRKGFATYHEGKLPVWQNFVLKLFQENLVKILIVTESILLHTEIVARTVILPTTCKVTKDGVSSIPCNQLLQLIGCAGRRGYDIEGNVVFLKSFYSGPKEAASLVLDNSFSICPCFKPSYSLVVNLMAKHKLSEVKKILGRSFADFEFYSKHVKTRKLKELDQKVLDCLEAKADLESKLFQGLIEVNKQKLSDAAMFTRLDIRMTIHSASQSGNALPGILLAVVPGQTESFYMVFGADNNFRLLPAGALDHVYKEVSPLDAVHKQSTGQTLQPPLIPPKENWIVEQDGSYGYVASGNLQTKEYVRLLMEYPVQPTLAKEGLQLRKEILVLEAQISNLIEKRKDLQTEKHNADKKSVSSLEAEAAEWQIDDSETWIESLRLLKILEKVDALSIIETQGSYVKLKPLGMLISRLHNVENELWLAVVVTSKYVKHLLPAEFTGIIATMLPLEPEVESLFIDQRELLYRVPKPLKDAFTSLEVLRKQVAALQGSYIPPLQFDTALAGMVYAWARGKPGTGGFYMVSINDGDIAWKLRSVTRFVNLVYQACSQVSVDISEPNDFNNLSSLARRAEDLLSRHLTAVDGNT